MILQTLPVDLAAIEVPDFGLSIAALFLGAAAVTVAGFMLHLIWEAIRSSHSGPHLTPAPLGTGPRRDAELLGQVRLLSLTMELKSNLALCQNPTPDALPINEFQSLCDELARLPYDTLEEIWAAYTEIIRINHYAEKASSFAGAMNDGSARLRCIQAKTQCRDQLASAIEALENMNPAMPTKASQEPELTLPAPPRTAGTVVCGDPSLI